MKRLLLILTCLCGLAMPQTTVNSATTPSTMAASQDDWVCIGKITLHKNSGGGYVQHANHDAFLYAKAIGPKLFYQIRIKYYSKIETYSVESCYKKTYCHDCHEQVVLDGKASSYFISLP